MNQQSPPPILGKAKQEARGDAQSKGACYIKRNALRRDNEGARRNTPAIFFFSLSTWSKASRNVAQKVNSPISVLMFPPLVKRSLSVRFRRSIYLSLFLHDNICYHRASNLMSQYKKAKLLVKQISTRSSEPCGATIESDSDAEQTVECNQSFVSEWQRSFADRPR